MSSGKLSQEHIDSLDEILGSAILSRFEECVKESGGDMQKTLRLLVIGWVRHQDRLAQYDGDYANALADIVSGKKRKGKK